MASENTQEENFEAMKASAAGGERNEILREAVDTLAALHRGFGEDGLDL